MRCLIFALLVLTSSVAAADDAKRAGRFERFYDNQGKLTWGVIAIGQLEVSECN